MYKKSFSRQKVQQFIISVFNSPVLFDHICSLFSDHVGRCTSMTSDDLGHDAGIDHSKTLDSVNSKSRIDDTTLRSGTHATGASKVTQSRRHMTRHAFPVVVASKNQVWAAWKWHSQQTCVVKFKTSALGYLDCL